MKTLLIVAFIALGVVSNLIQEGNYTQEQNEWVARKVESWIALLTN